MKNKPAGGPGSRVVKKVSAPKVEPRAKAVNPRGASQIGQSLGNHAEGGKVSAGKAVEPLYAGRGYSTPVGANTNSKPVQYGNCGTASTVLLPGLRNRRAATSSATSAPTAQP
jgi:hypothetical protein